MTVAVPVTLLTGFLGSGKTTLLNRLLDQGALADAALVINEFGDVGIDHLLVERADEGIIELSDGCLCCTIRGDLIDTLTRLLNCDPAPKRIVIETTGLADPAPILHAIMGHPVLSERLRLDGVVTVVDAVNGSSTLDAHEEAVKQAAVADRIVLSKTDLADDTSSLLTRLTRLNPAARIVTHAPEPADLFGCGLWNPATKTADVARWMGEAANAEEHDHHHHNDVNRHDSAIRAFTLITDRAVEATALTAFLDLLASAHGPNMLRMKGIVRLAEDPSRPVVLHGVQHIFHPPATLPAWPPSSDGTIDHRTRLVMIVRDMDESYIRRLFDAFTGVPRTDTPDRAALTNNPLAIPGV